MLRKIGKLWWVFRTFETPLAFLRALYTTGSGRAELRLRNGLAIEVRRNRWDAAIVMEMFDACPYVEGVELDTNSTVVDIGCYIGDFSLFVAKNYGARVVSFEPSPDNYEIARGNVERNRLGGLIDLHNVALGDGEPVTLYILRHGEEMHVTFEPVEGAKPRQVPSLDLGQALTKAGGEITLLKIDCEGFEYSIIDAAALDDFAPVKAIALEYHHIDGWQGKLAAMREKLELAGFKVSQRAPYLFCRR